METGTTEKSTFIYNPNTRNNVNSIPPIPPTQQHSYEASNSNNNNRISQGIYGLDSGSTYSTVGQTLSYFDFDGDNNVDFNLCMRGTASLQAHDVIIGCAHTIFLKYLDEQFGNGWAQRIEFYPGRYSENDYIVMALSVLPSIPQAYVDNTDILYDNSGNPVDRPYYQEDWAIIRLDRNLIDSCGALGLHSCGTAEIGLNIKTIGYPMTSSFINYKQYFATGTILSINGHNMWYSTYNTNTQGTSGGPVIDDNGYVYGINTSIIRSYVTQGTAIYSALFELIVAEREAAARRWAN